MAYRLHWLKSSHMTPSKCKGSWGMECSCGLRRRATRFGGTICYRDWPGRSSWSTNVSTIIESKIPFFLQKEDLYSPKELFSCWCVFGEWGKIKTDRRERKGLLWKNRNRGDNNQVAMKIDKSVTWLLRPSTCKRLVPSSSLNFWPLV